MRSMDGFGIPRELVEQVTGGRQSTSANAGRRNNTVNPTMMFERVEIHYLGKVYRASVEDFVRHGVHYYRPPYEAQYILPRKFFTTEDTNQIRLI